MKIKEYSVLKTIAMILVVIGHCNIFYIGNVTFPISYDGVVRSFVDGLIDMIYEFHVPMFFAISGAIYYINRNYQNKYNTFCVLLIKKFKRLMIPYFAVLIIAIVPIKFIVGAYPFNYNGTIDMVENIVLFRDNDHLWFLPVLFAIFLIFWMLEKLLKKKQWVIVAALVLYVMSLLIPDRYDTVLRYLLWFDIGYAFEVFRGRYNKISNNKLLVLFILGCVIFFGLNIMPRTQITIVNLFTANIKTFAAILSIYNIVLLYLRLKRTDDGRVWKIISTYSFDIYLYHEVFNYLILYILKRMGLGLLINNSLSYTFFILIEIICSPTLSIVVAVIINKIKKAVRRERIVSK